MKLEDLPAKLQDQARAQLGMGPRFPTSGTTTQPAPRASKGPTKTELDYARAYLAGLNARHEGVTLRLANGHKYTPDWIYWQAGQLHAVEVKGSYRLGSYQRARLAYDQAKLDFPDIKFVWAEKTEEGWNTK